MNNTEKIQELLATGMTQAQIAKQLGISEATVSRQKSKERWLESNQQKKDNRKYFKAIGRCTRCKNPAVPGTTLCEYHLEKERQAKAIARELRKERRKQGVCVDCGKPVVPGLTRCKYHNDQNNAIKRRYYHRHHAKQTSEESGK